MFFETGPLVETCVSTLCTGAALSAAQQATNSPFSHYEPYWVEGLPTTAAGLSAAVSAAGISLRAVLWLYPHTGQPVPPAAAAPPLTAGLTVQEGAAAQCKAALPEELAKLQAAVAVAPWTSPLAGLLVLPVPIGDPSCPFTTVPPASTVANPPWAAASSAAAALKLALAAAAAEPKPASASGGKPGSAVAGAKQGLSSSGAVAGRAAAPGSAGGVGGAAAGAAASGVTSAAAPAEVVGCKELARALLTVCDHAKLYDQWRAAVRVYRMPPPEPSAGKSCSSSTYYYQHLLSNVPPERQNVPIVLHALIEQVRSSALCQAMPCSQRIMQALQPNSV